MARINLRPIFADEGKRLRDRIAAVFPGSAAQLAAATRSVPVKIHPWGYVITLSSKVPGGATKHSGGRPLAAVWNWVWFGTKQRRHKSGWRTGAVRPRGRKVDTEIGRVTQRVQREIVKQLQEQDRRSPASGR